MSFWSKLDRLLAKAIVIISGASLFVMMGAIAANVLGRGFFESPLYGMAEIVSLSGVFLISFSIAHTERNRSHITIRILTSRFSERTQAFLSLFSFALSIGIMAMLLYGGLLMAIEDASTAGATTYILHLNKAPFRFIWVLGCAVLILFLIRHLIETVNQVRNK